MGCLDHMDTINGDTLIEESKWIVGTVLMGGANEMGEQINRRN